jgi:chemotaxis protein CheX
MEEHTLYTEQGIKDSHVDCIREAVSFTFSSICGLEPTFKIYEHNGHMAEGVVGIISIVAGEEAWSLMLGLPQDTSVAVARKFAGFDIPFDSADMADVVGELANIIAGDAVARLDKVGIKAELSLPTVARGSNLEMLLPDKLPAVRMDFNAPQGAFWLKLGFGKHHRSIKR